MSKSVNMTSKNNWKFLRELKLNTVIRVGGNHHQLFNNNLSFFDQNLAQTWHIKKDTYKWSCKCLILCGPSWAQGRHPLNKAPVELCREGPACRVAWETGWGHRSLGWFSYWCIHIINAKKPSKMLDFEGFCGPSWARTSDPLIMSQVL